MVGMPEAELQSIIDGPVGLALRNLHRVTGLGTSAMLNDDDKPNGLHSLCVRTDLPEELHEALLEDEVLGIYCLFLRDDDKPNFTWAFIGEDEYQALRGA